MSAPDLVVIRPATDLPAGFLPERLNGLWLDRSQMWQGPGDDSATLARYGGAAAVATGRFETRDDGAVAEVFEMRP